MSLLVLCFFPALILCFEFLQAFACVHVHGTEFEKIKYVVITSDSFGFIYNRTFTFDPDGKCRYNQKRGEANDSCPGKENVKCSFPPRELESPGIILNMNCRVLFYFRQESQSLL